MGTRFQLLLLLCLLAFVGCGSTSGFDSSSSGLTSSSRTVSNDESHTTETSDTPNPIPGGENTPLNPTPGGENSTNLPGSHPYGEIARPNERGILLVNTRDGGDAVGLNHSLNHGLARITSDGRYLFFISSALKYAREEIANPLNPNFVGYLHRYDLLGGAVDLIPLTIKESFNAGDYFLWWWDFPYDVSDDGRYVVFTANDSLEGGIELPEPYTDTALYRYDVEQESLEHISLDTNENPIYTGFTGEFAGTGDKIYFDSWGTNYELFCRDLLTKTTTKLTTGILSLGTRNVSDDGNSILFWDSPGRFPDESGIDAEQLYLLDVPSGTVERITNRPDGAPTDSPSFEHNLSRNGKFVAFITLDRDIVEILPPEWDYTSVYLYDVDNQTTKFVGPVEAFSFSGGVAAPPAVSNDGRFVLFSSRHHDLEPGMETSRQRTAVYLKDMSDQTYINLTARIPDPLMVLVDFREYTPSGDFTADGRYVVLNTRHSELRGYVVTYIYDTQTGEFRNIADELALHQASEVTDFSTSFTGAETAFRTNEFLMGEAWQDTVTNVYRVFLTDLDDNSLENCQTDDQPGEVESGDPGEHNSRLTSVDISEDGETVAFCSNFRDYQGGDLIDGSFEAEDTFVYTRERRVCYNVSVGVNLPHPQVSRYCTISGDGEMCYFVAEFPGQQDGLIRTAVYGLAVDDLDDIMWDALYVRPFELLWKTELNHTALISDRDGTHVAFVTQNVDKTDSNYLRSDIELYVVDAVSAPNYYTRQSIPFTDSFNGSSGLDQQVDISADGRYVVFTSLASDIIAGDTNQSSDVFLYDSVLATFSRVSSGASGQQLNGASQFASIDEAGRFVTFVSEATNIVANDSNGRVDVFVKDVETGAIALVSTNHSGQSTNGDSSAAEISGDGKRIIFRSSGSDIVAGSDEYSLDLFSAPNPLYPIPD